MPPSPARDRLHAAIVALALCAAAATMLLVAGPDRDAEAAHAVKTAPGSKPATVLRSLTGLIAEGLRTPPQAAGATP